MTGPIRYESLAAPLNDEERELMDPDTWDWESAEERPPVANPSAILEIRFSREEIKRVTDAASEAGVSIDAFIKDAVLRRASQTVPR